MPFILLPPDSTQASMEKRRNHTGIKLHRRDINCLPAYNALSINTFEAIGGKQPKDSAVKQGDGETQLDAARVKWYGISTRRHMRADLTQICEQRRPHGPVGKGRGIGNVDDMFHCDGKG